MALAQLAHKDDEFEIAQLLRNLADARDSGEIGLLAVHYLTDGAASSNPGHRPEQDRIEEALLSLADVFGIGEDDVTFSLRQDGGLARDPMLPSLIAGSIEHHKATDVIVQGPGSRDPRFPNHPDHQAIFRTALSVRPSRVNVWGLNPDTSEGVRVTGRRSTKLRVMEHHGSQFTVIRREDWPESWKGRPPEGWRLIEGRAVDPYTADVWSRYGNILLKERYIAYPSQTKGLTVY